MAVLPPPYITTRRPSRVAPGRNVAQKRTASTIGRRRLPGYRLASQMGADRHKHRVEAHVGFGFQYVDPTIDPRSAHQGPRSGVPRRPSRRAATGRQGSRSASSRRARAPHPESRPRDRGAPGGRRPKAHSVPPRPRAPVSPTAAPGRIDQPSALQRQIAQKPLDGVNRYRAIEIGTVAGCFARVVTNAAVDRGEGILGGEQAPRLLPCSPALT